MQLRLERDEQDGKATWGRLTIGDVELATLEPPWHGNKPFLSCVPAGTYRLVAHDSLRFPETWALVGSTVSHHQSSKPRYAVCIHMGNTVADTSGCILVGLRRDAEHLYRSGTAMRMVRSHLAGEAEHELLIVQQETTMFASIFGDKPVYQRLTAWGLMLFAIGETALVQLCGANLIGEPLCGTLTGIVDKLAVVLTALGLRRAAIT